MDFNSIIQFVSTLGFPIVVTLYLLTYIGKELKDMRECITKLDTFVRTKMEGK